MRHIKRGLPFGMTVGLGQVTLDNQPLAVLQRMPHETGHCARARRFL